MRCEGGRSKGLKEAKGGRRSDRWVLSFFGGLFSQRTAAVTTVGGCSDGWPTWHLDRLCTCVASSPRIWTSALPLRVVAVPAGHVDDDGSKPNKGCRVCKLRNLRGRKKKKGAVDDSSLHVCELFNGVERDLTVNGPRPTFSGDFKQLATERP